jgi:hypothetical protein
MRGLLAAGMSQVGTGELKKSRMLWIGLLNLIDGS